MGVENKPVLVLLIMDVLCEIPEFILFILLLYLLCIFQEFCGAGSQHLPGCSEEAKILWGAYKCPDPKIRIGSM